MCDSKVTCQENSDNSYFKQAKCISGSNSFPEGNGGILNLDLNRWCEGRNCHIATRCGKYRGTHSLIQEDKGEGKENSKAKP